MHSLSDINQRISLTTSIFQNSNINFTKAAFALSFFAAPFTQSPPERITLWPKLFSPNATASNVSIPPNPSLNSKNI